MNIKELGEKAIEINNKRITNEVFLIIQNDKELMKEYLRLVEKEGLDKVNMQLGKLIKNSYKLINLNDREENPTCTLIQSHQKFE